MKNINKSVLILLSFFAIPTIIYAGIVGSKHDLTTTGSTTLKVTTTQGPCSVCHTPHATGTSVPLWDRSLTAAAFSTYDTAGSPTYQSGVNVVSGVTKLCLGCHDGTVSLADFGGTTGSAGPKITATSTTYLGVDLTNDHPVGFTYSATTNTADPQIYNPAVATVTGVAGCTDGTTIASCLLFGSSNNRLECSSCHEVHNTSGQTKMLVKDNSASGLCLTCHNK